MSKTQRWLCGAVTFFALYPICYLLYVFATARDATMTMVNAFFIRGAPQVASFMIVGMWALVAALSGTTRTRWLGVSAMAVAAVAFVSGAALAFVPLPFVAFGTSIVATDVVALGVVGLLLAIVGSARANGERGEDQPYWT